MLCPQGFKEIQAAIYIAGYGLDDAEKQGAWLIKKS